MKSNIRIGLELGAANDRLAAYEALLEMGGVMWKCSTFWVIAPKWGGGQDVDVHTDDPTAAILKMYEKWKAGEADRQRENELGMDAARYCGAA